MKDIKFRGKRVDNGEWVYGTGITDFLNIEKTHRSGNTCWLWSNYGWMPVDPKTVGQFTGLNDKDEAEIYEGDILQGRAAKYSVKWHQKTCSFMADEGQFILPPYDWKKMEIVGNIHEKESQ